MKTKTYQFDDERVVLAAMIRNSRILMRILPHLQKHKNPFRSKWCNIVSGWCVSYAVKYEKAPRKYIRSLFFKYAEKEKSAPTVELMEAFLEIVLSEKEPKDNTQYVLDVASRLFNTVALERLRDQLEGDLIDKQLEHAQEHLNKFQTVQIGTADFVDVHTDQAALREALQQDESDVLIRKSGALGEFYGKHLEREGFVTYMAPEKRGKTWILIDLAWTAAAMDRRKTLFYSVGDMTQRQMMRRFAVRAARRPLKAGRIRIPLNIRSNPNSGIHVRYKEKVFTKDLSIAKAVESMEMVLKKTASKQSLLKLKCTPNSTTKITDIEADIQELSRNGWVPDVVIIDYMDILAPEAGTESQDLRHQINTSWKAARRLSQKHHVLVVSATQSDASSYEARIIKRSHFSDDKRKLAHVTGMIGINQEEAEKQKGLFRLNWVALREEEFYESRCVVVAGCLKAGNPCMKSHW